MRITQGIYAIPPVWQALSCMAGLTLYTLFLHHCARQNRKIRGWFLLGAALSLCLIACLTLWRRESGEGTLSLHPFEIFREAQEFPELYRSIMLNVALFVPLGMTLPGALGNKIPLGVRIALTVFFGAAVSCLVEFLQYRLRFGKAEIDDVICNTVGVFLGTLPFAVARIRAGKIASGTVQETAPKEYSTGQRNDWVDVLKYVSALLIIAIHCNLFQDVNRTLYFAVVNVICRFAVPFFAMCTGYFLAKKERTADNSAAVNRMFLRQEKKLILLYIVWSGVYLLWSIPKWINTGWLSAHAFLDYAVGAATKGAYFHLWYLLSLLLALPLLLLCLKKCKPKQMLALAICLYAVKAIQYAYYVFLPAWAGTALTLLYRLPGLFDAVFCLLPLLLLGAYCAREEVCGSAWKTIAVCSSLLILLISEKLMFTSLGRNDVSYLFLAFPLAYYVFRVVLLIRRPIKNSMLPRRLGAASLFIYCVHPIIIEIIPLSATLLRFAAAAALATLLGLLYAAVKEAFRKKKTREQET